MDDLTLGKMLTEAYRGQVDFFVQEGMSVSQSSSVVFDGSGKPDGERNVDQSRCSLKRTEDKSITSYKEACQSVSCRRL